MKLTKKDLQQRLPDNYLVRHLQLEIEPLLSEEEVIIIYGARQVGKSSMILNMAADLIDEIPVHYYALDSEIDPDLLNVDRLLSVLAADLHTAAKTVLIIDEAQRLPEIGLFIKDIYDRKLPLKIILSGSASFSIKSKIDEPLTGRKFNFHLSPLTLAEIFDHQSITANQLKKPNSSTDKILDDYLLYGGYPKVYFTPDPDLKLRRLTEIVDSYVKRDMARLFSIENTNSIRKVTTYIAENIGNLLSIDKISLLGGMSRREVEAILLALNKMFITAEIYPLSSSKFKETSKRPKVYFHDPGLRNAFLRKTSEALIISDLGHLFENTIGTQLINSYGIDSVNFWRTINQTEVDFIINLPSAKVAVETKYTWSSQSKPRALQRFTDEYHAIGMVLDRNNYWEYMRIDQNS